MTFTGSQRSIASDAIYGSPIRIRGSPGHRGGNTPSEHIDRLEIQLELIEKVELQNYIQSQILN
jgi:hypothetical protein